MSTAPVENSHNDVRYWFVADPNSLGPVGNFRIPDRVAAVVSEELTDDGRSFDTPAFDGGKIDAVFALMGQEEGEKVFGYIAAKLAGRASTAPRGTAITVMPVAISNELRSAAQKSGSAKMNA